ncbi:MAG: hypothetical protein QXR30_02845 [Candidatus Woesearchaeota archaeon]
MKKSFIKTLEATIGGILLVSIILLGVFLFFKANRLDQKIHIEKLLEDEDFRNAVIEKNLTLASEICTKYYEKLNLRCKVYVSGLKLEFINENAELIYNLFISGNFTHYNPIVARIFLIKNKR